MIFEHHDAITYANQKGIKLSEVKNLNYDISNIAFNDIEDFFNDLHEVFTSEMKIFREKDYPGIIYYME